MPALTSDEKGVTSVCICLSNAPYARIVTKRKKDLSRFLYHTKDHLAEFSEKKNGWWERPLINEILGQPAPIGAKSPILNRYSLVAPQP